MINRNGIGSGPVKASSASLQPESVEHAGALEIVVPYTGGEMTSRVVESAATLTAGLEAVLKLVAVYVAPYPAELRCPEGMEQHLTEQLTKIAERTKLPSSVHLIVSRDRNEGFRSALRPGSAVLLGMRKRFWRTREERLARELSLQGHHVSLLDFS